MLRLLSIRNFAVVEALEVEFERGFTVLTGETGAGKSILLDALSLLKVLDRGYAVVVVTHELNLAAEFADRIVLLDRGKTLRVGKPVEVYEQELLQQVFGTLLHVEHTARGTPKVTFSGKETE